MKKPVLAVDLIIEHKGKIVLIERKYKPYGIALPGGGVEYGETVEEAAKREALEETGLKIHIRRIFGVYSDPKRDQRRHAVAVVFVAEASGKPLAGSDAKKVMLVDSKEIPKDLAFDHSRILDDYVKGRISNSFERLMGMTEKLRGPKGCPWDKAQTLESLTKCFSEESGEVLAALKKKDMENLEEEMGDVCFTLALMLQVAKEKKLFTPESMFKKVAEKIIARHTWVFENDKVSTPEEALKLWKKNKKRLKKATSSAKQPR